MQDPKLENYQEKARKKFEDLDFGSEFFFVWRTQETQKQKLTDEIPLT